MQVVDTDPSPERFVGSFPITATTPEGDLTFTASARDTDDNPATADRQVVIDAVAAGTISGTAIKGRLHGATVSIYTFADGVRGALVGTGPTEIDGSFNSITVAEGTSGPLLIEVGGGGSYAEDSQPATVVSLDVNDRLRTVVPAFTDGGAVSGVVVTPATELAVSYLGWLVTAGQGGADLTARWTTAHAALEAMLGIASITTVVPSEPAQVDTLTAADRYGLVLLGLSRTAWTASTAGGGDAGAFGPTINAQKVTNIWSRDLADGCLDGKAGATPLTYGGVAQLTDEALRLQLAQAIVAYLGDSARNVTAFSGPAEVLPLLDAIATGGGNAMPGSCVGAVSGHLFDDNGRTFDRDGPLVTFDGATPLAGAFVRGTIMVEATATDVGMLDPAPTLRITLPMSTVDTDGDINDADIHATFDTAAIMPGGGTLTVVLDGFDHSNNHSDVAMSTRSFTVDNTPPVIAITAPAMDGQFLRGPVTIQYTITEANVMSTTALLDNMTPITPGFQVAAEGAHTISVTVVDRAGWTTMATRTFTIDNNAPVITSVATPSGLVVRPPLTITATATDNFMAAGSLGSAITVTSTPAPTTTTPGSTGGNRTLAVAYSTLPDGPFTARFNVTDRAGNAAVEHVVTRTIDSTPPVLNITGVTANTWYAAPVTVTFGQTDANPGTTTATLDSIPTTSPATVAGEGSHTLIATATDAAGNVTTSTVPFVVDLNNPTLTLQGPAPPTWVRGTLTFQVIADDTLRALGSLASNIVVTATGPGGAIATSPTHTMLADGRRRVDLTIDTTAVDDAAGTGSLTVRFDVTDRAGRTVTLPITRTMDNAAPVVTFTGFPFGDATSGWSRAVAPALVIGGDVIDASPTTISLTIGVATPVAAVVTGATWAHTPGSTLAEGSHVLTAVATDAAGNTASRTYTLGIDRTAPTASNTPRAVYDERNDTFGATGGRPQHIHSGTQVMLGGAGCQAIYKHAYLLDTAPAGDESPAANPLAFDWRANDGVGVGVDPVSLTYAVTSPGGTTTAAYALAPATSGSDTIATSTLRRDGPQAVPALGVVDLTEEGAFTITFAVRDRLGNAATLPRCWTYNPIGAPVDLTGAGAILPAAAEALDALAVYKLNENDAISGLLNNTHPGAGLMRVDLFNRTNDRVWFTFTPSITGATLTKTWSVKYQTISTQTVNVTCNYDTGVISGPPAICVSDGDYTGTLPGETVVTSTPFTATPTVRLFDMTTPSNPIVVPTCPTCEPLEFELVPGKPYTAVVAIKHLQPIGFTGITSGYLEGNTGVAPGPIVPTTRLPIAPLTTTGDGVNRYCSAFTVLTPFTARCTQATTVGGVRWAAALGFGAAQITTVAASAAGSTLTFKRTGTNVLATVQVLTYSWSTTESPTP
ncbi:MAG: hypothetical protein IPJ61_21325 [Tessaracoccus sp.]|uniref:Ig-like domain-containing protein n=1 Tax=Tessaracoccus sp. TaxID=1971211 RepID=UPI001EB92692|nr:Ig-like domain-containing protein [Tessaracoccus sp.]MBK7823531.1 hypothetical protein [Tessaracoccus sp.]